MCPTETQIEERRRDIQRIPSTNNSDFRLKTLHKMEPDWVVRFLDPGALIHQAFTFEAAVL